MAKLIDLSIPVRHGDGRLGLKVEFSTPYSYENCNWQGSCFSMFCHHATHVDAPNHFLKGGKGIDEAPLTRLMGAAALVALDDHGSEAAITGDELEERGRHVRAGDIVILRTGWSDRHWGTETFWRQGPYLDLSGADWLVWRGAKAVVYDFSEEYVVRKPGFRGEDCLVHHRILGEEIYNIEYVHNLTKIVQPRLTIMAMPLKLVGLDGSPARVLAIEGADLPETFEVA
ncbi:MAG: cyclase family protein [Parvibaculaceae bacterium]